MREHGRLKSGLNPFDYKGVDPLTPYQYFVFERAPTSDDYSSFNIGDVWFDETDVKVWILVNKNDNSGTWSNLGLIPFSATSFPTDSGTATQSGGELNIVGSGIISTSGSGNTVTVESSTGTDGQVLIGGGSDPAWANITSSGGTVSITEGANSINLEVTGVGGVTFLTADTGSATPAAGTITITGDSNISTSAAADTLTTNLNNSISIPGPLTLGALGAGVMQTNAGGVVTSDNGTDGQVLIGGGAAPAWANITSTGGSVTITNGPNTVDLSFAGGGGAGVSSFVAYQDGDADNVTGTGSGSATYTLGVDTAFAAAYDVGGDVSLGGGSPVTFTAPSTGKYLLTLVVYWERPNHPYQMQDNVEANIVTTARTYDLEINYYNNQSAGSVSDEEESLEITTVADMTVGDTATYTIRVDAPANPTPPLESVNIVGGTALEMTTFISGFLIA